MIPFVRKVLLSWKGEPKKNWTAVPGIYIDAFNPYPANVENRVSS